MVTSWLLNSISKDLVKAFIYATSARELWNELEQRFGECNGPMLYQIEREITSISQGNLSIVNYFTKLKCLWDEFACLWPTPECRCEAAKEAANLAEFHKVMQFLMELNEEYDHIRNQILVMEPFPSVNKAYSMILRVESQRDCHNSIAEGIEGSVMMVRGQQDIRKVIRKQNKERKGPMDKKKLYCTHCKRDGHAKETCFKIHGYPEWYKGLMEQRGKPVAGSKA